MRSGIPVHMFWYVYSDDESNIVNSANKIADEISGPFNKIEKLLEDQDEQITKIQTKMFRDSVFVKNRFAAARSRTDNLSNAIRDQVKALDIQVKDMETRIEKKMDV